MSRNPTLALGLMCLLLVALGAADPEVKEDLVSNKHVDFSGEVPVVVAHVTDESGRKLEFRVPYYDPTEAPYTPEEKQLSVDTINEAIGIASSIVDSALIKGMNSIYLHLQLGSIGAQFGALLVKFQVRSWSLANQNKRKSDNFVNDSMDIFPELVDRARAESQATAKDSKAKYNDKAERVKIGKRVMTIYKGIKRLVRHSPVGLHLNFRQLTIDGQLLLDEATEYIKFMKESGLGFVIDLGASIFRMISKKSEAIPAQNGQIDLDQMKKEIEQVANSQ